MNKLVGTSTPSVSFQNFDFDLSLNFIVFNKYLWPNRLDGLFFTIFVIAIAAAEAAVAIAIIINLYRSHHSIDVEETEEMKF